MADLNDTITLFCFAALFPIGIGGYVRHDYTVLVALGIVCALFSASRVRSVMRRCRE